MFIAICPCLFFLILFRGALQAFSVPKFFILDIFVEEFIDLIHFEVGNDLSKLVDPDVEAFQFVMDFRLSFFGFFLRHDT